MGHKRYFIPCTVIVMLAGLGLGGCTTTRGDTTSSLLDYQRQVTLLESRLALYEQSVRDAIPVLDSLRTLSGDTATGIDEIIYLFGEYQSGVNQLLQLYNTLREQIEYEDQNSSDTGSDIRSDDSP